MQQSTVFLSCVLDQRAPRQEFRNSGIKQRDMRPTTKQSLGSVIGVRYSEGPQTLILNLFLVLLTLNLTLLTLTFRTVDRRNSGPVSKQSNAV